jgi:hypothetical protein
VVGRATGWRREEITMVDVRVVPTAGGWVLEVDGAHVDTFDTEEAAVGEGRICARNHQSDLVIYDAEGHLARRDPAT